MNLRSDLKPHGLPTLGRFGGPRVAGERGAHRGGAALGANRGGFGRERSGDNGECVRGDLARDGLRIILFDSDADFLP